MRVQLDANVLAVGLAAALLAGCAAPAHPEPGGGSPPRGGRVEIPPGHLPRPGACRICFPTGRRASSRRRGRAMRCASRSLGAPCSFMDERQEE